MGKNNPSHPFIRPFRGVWVITTGRGPPCTLNKIKHGTQTKELWKMKRTIFRVSCFFSGEYRHWSWTSRCLEKVVSLRLDAREILRARDLNRVTLQDRRLEDEVRGCCTRCCCPGSGFRTSCFTRALSRHWAPSGGRRSSRSRLSSGSWKSPWTCTRTQPRSWAKNHTSSPSGPAPWPSPQSQPGSCIDTRTPTR